MSILPINLCIDASWNLLYNADVSIGRTVCEKFPVDKTGDLEYTNIVGWKSHLRSKGYSE